MRRYAAIAVVAHVLTCAESKSAALAQTYGGTTGVAIWTPHRALLAIDSRITLIAGDTTRPGPDACKIQSAGRFYFAIAGLYHHEATKFDAWSLASEAIAGARTVPEAAALAERRIVPELLTAVANMQSTDLAGYTRNYSKAWLAIWVAGWDDGPAMAGRELLPGPQAQLRPIRHEFPPAGTPAASGMMGFSVFGERNAIDQVYRTTKAIGDLVTARGPVDAARSLVQIEVLKEPAKVGLPITILELTESGPEWVQRGLCRVP